MVKIGNQWVISKEAMEREYGEMKISEINPDINKKVIEMIIEDRLDILENNIIEGNIEDGYEFVFRDLFHQSDWRKVAVWPGNWRFGVPFRNKVRDEERYHYIVRKGDDKSGAALYRIDLDKFPYEK